MNSKSFWSLAGWCGVAVMAFGLTTPAFGQESPLLAPAPAGAGVTVQGAPTLTTYGNFFTRYEMRRNYGSEGKVADFVRYSTLLGIKTSRIDVGDGIHLQARIAPKVGGFWQEGGDSLTDAAIGLHEGAIRLESNRGWLEVGRFEMAYGEELVIGPVGWHHIGRAFDGARVHFQTEPKGAWVDVFATQLEEGQLVDRIGDYVGAGDGYFMGAYAGLGALIGGVKDLDVYIFNRLRPGFTDAGEQRQDTGSIYTLGTRAKGRAGPVDYRTELGVQTGRAWGGTELIATLAYQADLEVGVNAQVLKGLRFALEGFYASGDDPNTTDKVEAWDQLFPTAHKWLGFMDQYGRSNIAGAVGHLKVKPMAKLIVMADGHYFTRPQVAEGESQYQGTEIDLGAKYIVAKGVSFRVAYDLFLPEPSDADMLRFVEVELRTKF